MQAIRYCRRCHAHTNHQVEPVPRLLYRWIVLWPIMALAYRLTEPPVCLVCYRMTTHAEKITFVKRK